MNPWDTIYDSAKLNQSEMSIYGLLKAYIPSKRPAGDWHLINVGWKHSNMELAFPRYLTHRAIWMWHHVLHALNKLRLAFVWGIHRGPVNSPYKWPITRKCFHLMSSSCINSRVYLIWMLLISTPKLCFKFKHSRLNSHVLYRGHLFITGVSCPCIHVDV